MPDLHVGSCKDALNRIGEMISPNLAAEVCFNRVKIFFERLDSKLSSCLLHIT